MPYEKSDYIHIKSIPIVFAKKTINITFAQKSES